MSKFKTVCELIEANKEELSRKELVAKIAEETGFNAPTVNVYYSKFLNAGKPAKQKVEKEEPKAKEFVRSSKTTTSKGHEITIDRQLTFLTSITVKNIKTGFDAVTTAGGDKESIDKAINDLMLRLTPANEKVSIESRKKKSSSVIKKRRK